MSIPILKRFLLKMPPNYHPNGENDKNNHKRVSRLLRTPTSKTDLIYISDVNSHQGNIQQALISTHTDSKLITNSTHHFSRIWYRTCKIPSIIQNFSQLELLTNLSTLLTSKKGDALPKYRLACQEGYLNISPLKSIYSLN